MMIMEEKKNNNTRSDEWIISQFNRHRLAKDQAHTIEEVKQKIKELSKPTESKPKVKADNCSICNRKDRTCGCTNQSCKTGCNL